MEDRDNMERRLWEFIDGISNDAEREQLSALIATNLIWKAKYEELTAFNTSLVNSLETEEPSVRFTKNVMEMVGGIKMAPSINGYINPSIIKGIAAFFLISITLVLGYAFSTISWYFTPSTIHLPEIKMPTVNLDGLFSSTFVNVAIGVNVIVGLLFADMMLRKRNRKQQHQ